MLHAINLDRMGDLVMSIGSGEFGGRFCSLIHNTFDVAGCTALVFNSRFEPRPLIMEGRSEDVRKAHRRIHQYIDAVKFSDTAIRIDDGDFCADIYVICPEMVDDASPPDRIDDITNEIVILGKVSEKVYYIAFQASSLNEYFDDEDIQTIKRLSGFILRTLHRHHELAGTDDESGGNITVPHLDCPAEMRAEMLDHLRDVMISGPHRLTPREAEICARIIMGYSAVAISLNLSISTHTVATHRKRAYAKMGILSLNELFVRYFSTVHDFHSRMMN